jgi:hypothetical protein
MGLINPKPRFAWDDATDMVYDYIAQRDIPLAERYATDDGVWNLIAVKNLILSGQPVEGARIGPPEKAKAATPVVPIKPPTPGPGTQPAPSRAATDPETGKSTTDATPPTGQAAPAGLSVAQLLALKLSPLQAAALGITAVQMTATGVPPSQVAGWGMNAERADALKLTEQQRAVLLPA